MMIDMSGEPRSNEEIQEAIDAIKKEIVRGQPQPIMVFYGTIIDAMAELLKKRKEHDTTT